MIGPCVGCGYCCKKATCTLGLMRFGTQSPCRALIFKEGRYWCSLVLGELNSNPIRDELAIGAGCCSSLNSDRAHMLAKLKEEGHGTGG